MKMRTEKRNPLIVLVGGFLEIMFHTKLKYEPSHFHFLIHLDYSINECCLAFFFPCRQLSTVVNILFKLFVNKIN